MNLTIKTAGPGDIDAILKLMAEFAEHQNLTEFLEVTEKKLADVMFGKDRFVHGIIVRDDETPIAYAFFYQYFSSFRGEKSVYLEDIFITEQFRNRGIGEELVKEIAVRGKEFAAVRMDFQVLRSNISAINFYKKLGAIVDEDERHVKIVDESFQNLAKK
ncbi:MAG: GNAT family N-acetyltransferase [Pyrinomonadaceae bacterium]|nr:GNAT family N-acetyltransferase [Pyrinomonadaceae bacterium]